MTAEVAILNRQGVALAADSAATFYTAAGPKILNADKIFALSRYEPVGVMTYGDAEFMGIPWETIIKIYRDRLGTQSFPTLSDYGKSLCRFLETDPMFPSSQQQEFFTRQVARFFLSILQEIRDKVELRLKNPPGNLSRSQVSAIVARTIGEHDRAIRGCDPLPGRTRPWKAQLRSDFLSKVEQVKHEIFQRIPMSDASSRKLTEIGLNVGVRAPRRGNSGLVVAGFGSEEIFPSLQSCEVVCTVLNQLVSTTPDDSRIDNETSALVAPFAQGEMVHMFMEGVDPDYQNVVEHVVGAIMNEYPRIVASTIGLKGRQRRSFVKQVQGIGAPLVEAFRKELSEYREEEHWGQVVSVVENLPKEELAEMAEALVSLTSFKRRVSEQVESVGGPIDVAVISKGDGLIWIKQKRYFDFDLNPQFLAKLREKGKPDGDEDEN